MNIAVPNPVCGPSLSKAISRFNDKWIESTDREFGGTRCWEWSAQIIHGYGSFYFDSKNNRAHRISYMMFVGKIPDGLLVCHKCNNKCCVNPSHLYIGTPKQNSQDAVRDGLSPVGSRQPNSKLTESLIDEIRSLWSAGNITQVALASQFGVDQTLVSLIVMNKAWKHCAPASQPPIRIPPGRPKINFEIASQIRKLYAGGASLKDISMTHGISLENAGHVVRNEQWHDPSWAYKRRYNKSKRVVLESLR